MPAFGVVLSYVLVKWGCCAQGMGRLGGMQMLRIAANTVYC